MRKREKIEQDALIFRNVPAATLETLLDIRDLLSQEKPYPYPSFSTIPYTPVSDDPTLNSIAEEAGKKSTQALKDPFPISEKGSVEEDFMGFPPLKVSNESFEGGITQQENY